MDALGILSNPIYRPTTLIDDVSLRHLRLVPCVERPIVVICDNTVVIVITNDPRCHSKTNHINDKYHYIIDVHKKHEVLIESVFG